MLSVVELRELVCKNLLAENAVHHTSNPQLSVKPQSCTAKRPLPKNTKLKKKTLIPPRGSIQCAEDQKSGGVTNKGCDKKRRRGRSNSDLGLKEQLVFYSNLCSVIVSDRDDLKKGGRNGA